MASQLLYDLIQLLSHFAQALAKRFRCKAYPCSQGLLLAIHHEACSSQSLLPREAPLSGRTYFLPADASLHLHTDVAATSPLPTPQPWKINGVAVKAVMPMSYVQGPLEGLADGCGGLRALVDPEKVSAGNALAYHCSQTHNLMNCPLLESRALFRRPSQSPGNLSPASCNPITADAQVTRRSDDLWRNEPLWKEYEVRA